MELKKTFRKRFANMQVKAKHGTELLAQRSGLLTPSTPVDPHAQDFFSISFENTGALPSSESRGRSRTNSVSSYPQDDKGSFVSRFSSQEVVSQSQSFSASLAQSSTRPKTRSDLSSTAETSTKSSLSGGAMTPIDDSSKDFDDEMADEIAEKILSVVSSRQEADSWCLS